MILCVILFYVAGKRCKNGFKITAKAIDFVTAEMKEYL